MPRRARLALPIRPRRTVSMRLLPRWAVDLLPVRLWEPGNIVSAPGGDWHPLYEARRRRPSAATVEWRGLEDAPPSSPVSTSRITEIDQRAIPLEHPQLPLSACVGRRATRFGDDPG